MADSDEEKLREALEAARKVTEERARQADELRKQEAAERKLAEQATRDAEARAAAAKNNKK